MDAALTPATAPRAGIGRRPVLLLLANLVAGVVTEFVAIAALGGYRLEHVSRDTALTDALQLIIFFGGIGALILGISTAAAARSRRWARITATTTLLVAWPVLGGLTALTHALMF